jgi:hypothetical protein
VTKIFSTDGAYRNGHKTSRYRAVRGHSPECRECRRIRNERSWLRTYGARERAKLDGLICTLDGPVFGDEFVVNKKKVRGHAGPNALSPTLDRICPELGYTRKRSNNFT